MGKIEFDRSYFEYVKRLQAKGKSREYITEMLPFGRETVRKAMKAPNWPQYRKNQKNELRKRIMRQNNAVQTTPGLEPYIPQPNEGKYSVSFNPQATPEPIKLWKVVVAVTLVIVIGIVLILKG